MSKGLFPEMVKLIIKTIDKSPKQGVPILNEWHCEIPSDPHEEYLPVDAFQRRKDLLVNLTVNETLVYSQAKYMVIQSLTVTEPSETLDRQVFAPPHEFTILHMLGHLGLDSIQPNKINWFLKPIFFFPCLRSLVLTNTFLDREGALMLWKVFWQLEVLSLIDVHFLDMSAVRENMKGMLCPRLTKLYLHYNNSGGFPMEDQYQLLLASPSLKAFNWALPRGHEEHTFSDDFNDHRRGLGFKTVQDIEQLNIVGDMDDYGIALAMNNMPGIRSVSITVDNRIGILSLVAISNLAANLTRFEAHSPFTTSVTIENVLSSCPLLHTLIARSMTAYETTRDKKRKWICAPSLKVLCLTFILEDHEGHLQDEVCEKLAQLTQLEQLIMNEPCDERPGISGLRLLLGQGLERLSTLKNLKFLSSREDYKHPSRMQERAWMLYHWPQLVDVLHYHS
ncbi:hypothetical protein EC968_008405 [Mortierella alpina]|nr:hypothetical protein EC968_008405 [Mortierella alpina]